jgi:hypothetical protein
MTLSIWVRLNKEACKDTVVVYEQGGYWRGFNVIIDRCWLQINGWNLPGDESSWAGTTLYGGKLKDGEWNHVAVVLDGGEVVTSDALTLYLNGERVASGEGSQLWFQGDDNGLGQVQQSTLYRGRQVLALDPFKGSMDDLAIWNLALSEQQIEELVLASFAED